MPTNRFICLLLYLPITTSTYHCYQPMTKPTITTPTCTYHYTYTYRYNTYLRLCLYIAIPTYGYKSIPTYHYTYQSLQLHILITKPTHQHNSLCHLPLYLPVAIPNTGLSILQFLAKYPLPLWAAKPKGRPQITGLGMRDD